MPSMLVTDPRLRLLRDKMAGIHRRRAKLRTKKVALNKMQIFKNEFRFCGFC